MTKSIACAVGLFAVVAVAGVARAQTTHPVEWKVSEGGNGHWYELVVPTTRITAADASSAAIARGGSLASIGSVSENRFVFALSSTDPSRWTIAWPGATQIVGPWIGARYLNNAWQWSDGTPWNFSNWSPGNPNYLPDESAVLYMGEASGPPTDMWNNLYPNYQNWGFVVEWATDCNTDGIVDFGQILRGELADDDHNGIPDVCETSITGVLPPSVPSQGGVTITINGRNFPDNPTVLVGGTAATNVVRVSATRITATAPAGLPGMTSISVNGFTLPDAFYYRPECGSDLDQNGEVDAADISIILLDFGPCYPAPVAAPTTGPLPPALSENAARP